jgi:membrane fusion protein (multidrug efflux system)
MAVEAERAAQIGIAEARAKLQEGEAAAAYAGQEADRQILLEREGLTPKREFGSAMAEVRKQKAAVESLRLAIGRQERELASQKSERISRIEALKREADRLAGEETKLGATVKRLNSEVTLRQIVAPTDGVIGEVANFRVGSVISAGEKLGAIIPAGRLKVVAAFDPGKALGRVRPGQKARLRLAGFPWTQYGTLPAIVTGVANEVRDGYVRVELSPSPDSRIPLQHGLPAITEIEVERVSPARLLLRLAGQSLTGRSQQPPANDSQSAAPGRQQ